MKTRTLLLLAVACGLAIMTAGAVFLFQLTTQDDLAEPVPIGAAVQVGDMEVSVTRVEPRDAGVLVVLVELGGTRDESPADDFRLIASGRVGPILGTTCAPTDAVRQACSLSFDVSAADGTSRVLFYERGDEQARWVLA